MTTRALQKRSSETRETILKASLHEFARLGFEGASTRVIADLAGVNHNLIRHHFGSKEDLWKATASEVFSVYRARINSRLAGLDGVDTKTTARLLLKEFILFSAETPEFHRFMMQANQGDPSRLSWLVGEFLTQGNAQEVQLLNIAQKAGVFVSGNPGILRYIFIGAATSIFAFATEFSEISGQDAFDPDVIDEHVDLVLKLFTRELP